MGIWNFCRRGFSCSDCSCSNLRLVMIFFTKKGDELSMIILVHTFSFNHMYKTGNKTDPRCGIVVVTKVGAYNFWNRRRRRNRKRRRKRRPTRVSKQRRWESFHMIPTHIGFLGIQGGSFSQSVLKLVHVRDTSGEYESR